MGRKSDIWISMDGATIVRGATEAGTYWIGENCGFDRALHSPETGVPCKAYAMDIAVDAILDGLLVDVDGKAVEIGKNGMAIFSEEKA